MQTKFQKFIKLFITIIAYLVPILFLITTFFAIKNGLVNNFKSDITVKVVIIAILIIIGIPFVLRTVIVKLYQNQKWTPFYLLSIITTIIFAWMLFTISTVLIKSTQTYGKQPTCKSGYVAVGQGFDGAGYSTWKCEKTSIDAGKICTADSDCQYNCITQGLDTLEKTCPALDITVGGYCKGITGVCSTIKVDSGTIYKKDYVNAVHFIY